MTQPLPPEQIPTPEDRPHKPADDREEVYYEGSPLLRGDLLKLFGWGLLAGALIAGGIALCYWAYWIVGVVLVVIGILALFVPVVLVRSTRYRISNYRIDYERGIFSRRIDTLELWHVEDIRFSQSLLDRIMSVGNIEVISHDETTPKLMLHGLPNPRNVFDQLKQRIISVKRQRGVIKMDMG